jgi:hypothetical protein
MRGQIQLRSIIRALRADRRSICADSMALGMHVPEVTVRWAKVKINVGVQYPKFFATNLSRGTSLKFE